MTDQTQTALDQFLAAAKRIEAISADADRARSLPDRYVLIAASVQVNTPSWTIPAEQQRAYAAAQRVRDTIAAEHRADGEHQRDAQLNALAAELQAIRAALPSLAASAAVELGRQARALDHEANGGADA